LQGRICRQPRSRRRVTAAVYLTDEPPDGSHGGPDGLDRATELVLNRRSSCNSTSVESPIFIQTGFENTAMVDGSTLLAGIWLQFLSLTVCQEKSM
jgi:hypothetical protein